jgi:Uma2 family endonuclease
LWVDCPGVCGSTRRACLERPEPDVLVIRADADPGPLRTAYQPADVLLVVEVVSPDSQERDRKRKPQLYAEAGIPHFWRVEDNSRHPTVYVVRATLSKGSSGR